jgi:ubiquinone/menaquinone biosynthesis C-methylase UbiE
MAYYDEGAAAYDRFMGRWSRLDIPALLAAAELTIDHHVLDVATGTGEVALAAEATIGPAGRVVAADLSVGMPPQGCHPAHRLRGDGWASAGVPRRQLRSRGLPGRPDAVP